MRRRTCVLVLCTLIAGIALGVGRIRAAEPNQNLPLDPYRESSEDTEARWEKVDAELRRLSAAVSEQRTAAAEDPSGRQRDTDDRLAQVDQTLEGMWAVIHEMRKTHDELTNQMKRVEQSLSKKLIETSYQDDKPKRSTSPKPVPMHGRLVVENWTGKSHRMVVNGQSYWVSPGRTILTVPHAIVEAYMPNHEGPKLWGLSNWKWNGQGYEMFITLRTT